MSTEGNTEIALSLVEALNARDLTLWSRHLSEDYAAEHPGVSVTLDKTRSIAYHQRFVTASPTSASRYSASSPKEIASSSSGRRAAPTPNGWPP